MSTSDSNMFIVERDSSFAMEPAKERQNALFAIPKKGRLYEKCISLLNGAGLEYDRPNRLDVAHCKTLPITLVFLPASDIASYVGEGNVDIGITGRDWIRESQVDVDQIMVSLTSLYYEAFGSLSYECHDCKINPHYLWGFLIGIGIR